MKISLLKVFPSSCAPILTKSTLTHVDLFIATFGNLYRLVRTIRSYFIFKKGIFVEYHVTQLVLLVACNDNIWVSCHNRLQLSS